MSTHTNDDVRIINVAKYWPRRRRLKVKPCDVMSETKYWPRADPLPFAAYLIPCDEQGRTRGDRDRERERRKCHVENRGDSRQVPWKRRGDAAKRWEKSLTQAKRRERRSLRELLSTQLFDDLEGSRASLDISTERLFARLT